MILTPPRDHRWTWMWCGRVTLFQVAQFHVNANHYAKKKVINPKSLKTPFVRHSLQIQCICVRVSMIHMEHCRHTHTQLRSDARRARLTKEKRNDKSNDRSHTRGNAERREMHMSFRVFDFALGQVRQSPILHDDWRKYKSQIWTLLLRMARKGKRDKKNTKS